ncbi:MAG: hypothetical protein OEY18_17420 [Candidatus Aminicenantes bacterium]|nr:hypothetical protein [Candidatus Aminicenantes bacterium]
MNIFFILFVLLLMLILIFAINLIINRGKIELRYLLFILMYSLLVGAPVAYVNLYPKSFNAVVYVIYYVIVLLPSLGHEFYKCIKGRQTWRGFSLIFIGVVLILLTPLFELRVRYLVIGAGWILITGFFIYLFRYPHLNPMWLDDAVKKAAENIEKDCKYSSKPVTVPIPSQKTSCASSFGLSLFLKKKNAVVKMTKGLHEKLGRPNMEKFAEELVKKIKEKIREEKGKSR